MMIKLKEVKPRGVRLTHFGAPPPSVPSGNPLHNVSFQGSGWPLWGKGSLPVTKALPAESSQRAAALGRLRKIRKRFSRRPVERGRLLVRHLPSLLQLSRPLLFSHLPVSFGIRPLCLLDFNERRPSVRTPGDDSAGKTALQTKENRT